MSEEEMIFLYGFKEGYLFGIGQLKEFTDIGTEVLKKRLKTKRRRSIWPRDKKQIPLGQISLKKTRLI
jgi:hypothetical protein